jgi:hypothetical protein
LRKGLGWGPGREIEVEENGVSVLMKHDFLRIGLKPYPTDITPPILRVKKSS